MNNRQTKWLLRSLILVFFIACGGDSTDSTTPSTTNLTSNNTAPSSNAGDNKTANINEPLTLSGIGTDSDGSIERYEWREGTTVLATTASFVYTSAVAGDHTLTFIVTDNQGATNSSSITINIVMPQTSISGKIKDYTTATPLVGVTVSVGVQNVMSNASGEYNLTGITPNNRIVLNVEKTGYALSSKIVSLSNTPIIENFNINLLPIGSSQDFDPTIEKLITVPNSTASVNISANSLVLANGDLPNGSIHANLTPVNPTLDIGLMPGDMMSRNSNNQLVPIESYGAIIANFTDSNANKLNLSSGSTATIHIPIASRGITAPNSIPLYYFDENQGVWIEEGTATKNGDYYEGNVSHFSTWNADYLYDNINITGCVEDVSGNKITNALVFLNGGNYNGYTTAYSNSNGQFTIMAKKSAISLIAATKNRRTSNSIKVGERGETISDFTMTECLLFGSVSSTTGLKVQLTWGENPRDLDTHVIGPNSYHIYYSNKGNLNSDEYKAELDVDDTSSYGPEIFTALSFPSGGTYHYAINHYSGSSSIENSLARVELTINGNVTTFIAPGSTESYQEWWNVFDIIVDEASGNVTIQPINTYSTSTPSSFKLGLDQPFILPPKK